MAQIIKMMRSCYRCRNEKGSYSIEDMAYAEIPQDWIDEFFEVMGISKDAKFCETCLLYYGKAIHGTFFKWGKKLGFEKN